MNTIFSVGLRPFFFAAALFAGIAIPVWGVLLEQGWQLPSGVNGRDWHIHEMLFGYFPAVLAGFILTAMPNWTGRPALRGVPLATALCVWLGGRVAMAFAPGSGFIASMDLLFIAALLVFVLREIFASRLWRHLPIAILIAALGLANGLFHARVLVPDLAATAERLALAVMAIFISLIGGRIIPAFTRNWLQQNKIASQPAEFSAYDKVVILLSVVILIGWVLSPYQRLAGAGLALLGGLHLLRLVRWKFWKTFSEPLVTVLHLGYLWLALAFTLMGVAIVAPELMPPSAAVHALTTGAVGTMTLAVMTRATRGHTGRALHADGISIGIYLCITSAAVLRTGIGLMPFTYLTSINLSAGLWSLAFVLFLISYGPMLLSAKPG